MVENLEVRLRLISAKKSYKYVRLVALLIVTRELFISFPLLLFNLDQSRTMLYKIVTNFNRAFLQTFIDTIEFIALCWLFRAQHNL